MLSCYSCSPFLSLLSHTAATASAATATPTAGFAHSAFTFAHESLVARTVGADAELPPGALVSFLQKGLQYVEIESHLQEDGTERACDEPFYLTAPHVCRLRSSGGGAGGSRRAGAAGSGGDWNASTSSGGGSGDGDVGAVAAAEVPPSEVTLLSGHRGEVFTVAVSAARPDLLATGSADGTARVWSLGDAGAAGNDAESSGWSSTSNSSGRKGASCAVVLRHGSSAATGTGLKAGKGAAVGDAAADKSMDVSTLDWSVS